MADVFKELIVKIGSQTNTSGFKKLDSATAKSKHNIDVFGNSIRNALGFVAAGIGIKQIIDTNVQIDSMNRSFEALAGSAEGGVSQIRYLREEANRLGQDFLVLGEAYKGMFAAGKGAGFSQATTRDVFSSVLEEATVLGLSSEKTEKALLALTQMMSKGKVSAEELRGQLGDALPDALVLSARAMGVTSQEFEKLMAKGIRSSEFLPKLARVIREEYGRKLPKAVGSFRAELARLTNEFNYLQVTLLEGEAGKEFANSIREITKMIKSQSFLDALKLTSKLITLILKNLKTIIALGAIYFIVDVTNKLKLLGIELLGSNVALQLMKFNLDKIIAGNVIAGLTGMANVFKVMVIQTGLLLGNIIRIAAPLLFMIELFDTAKGKQTILAKAMKDLYRDVKKNTGMNELEFSRIFAGSADVEPFPVNSIVNNSRSINQNTGRPVVNVQNNVNVDKNGNVNITTRDVSNYVDSKR